MRLHLLISTHTERHLASTLAAAAGQTAQPASVVLSVDGEAERLGEALDEGAARLRDAHPEAHLLLATRPHTGEARSAQVRNNAVRALLAEALLGDDDLLVFLDGDMLLPPDGLARQIEAACTDASGRKHGPRGVGWADWLIGYRANLTERETASVRATRIADPGWPQAEPFASAAPRELHKLAKRARRYRRHLLGRRLGLHRLGLLKPHKPKLISCHTVIRAGLYRHVGGFDEAYVGYGFEDDDLGRRLLRAGAVTRVIVDTVAPWPLWHPTRVPEHPNETPNAKRFAATRDRDTAEFGLDNPRPQGELSVARLG